MSVRLLVGDVRELLATLEPDSVQCVVTSPPYFGLRDYGTAAWEGGSPDCDHRSGSVRQPGERKASTLIGTTDTIRAAEIAGQTYRHVCKRCGARRTDRQIGLEPTVDEYVAQLVAVFREVRRILRPDGVVWLNLGDSYVAAPNSGHGWESSGLTKPNGRERKVQKAQEASMSSHRDFGSLKPKDLVGIPWTVAFALRADGWWLRQGIVWSKPNPMPESVTDRCTKAHEDVFLLSKSARYFYDGHAIAEPAVVPSSTPIATKARTVRPDIDTNGGGQGSGAISWESAVRNKRSVWTVSTEPFPEAHFATFPTELVKPMILAGTSEAGACFSCGAPRERILERVAGGQSYAVDKSAAKREDGLATAFSGYDDGSSAPTFRTTGWKPTCSCGTTVFVPCVVLDPFAGSGTTGKVAQDLGRDAILVELNPDYAAIAERRCAQASLPLRV